MCHLWLRETLAHLSWSWIWLQLLSSRLPSVSSLASCGIMLQLSVCGKFWFLIRPRRAIRNGAHQFRHHASAISQMRSFPVTSETSLWFLSDSVCVTRMKLAVFSIACFSGNSRFACQVSHFFHSAIGASQPFFANRSTLSVTA